MFMLVILVELGLWVFAEHVASTAAQAGARTGRQEEPGNTAWKSSVQLVADNWVESLVGDAADGPVNVTSTYVQPLPCSLPIVEVQVSFTMKSLIGGFGVSGMSQGPVENYYPDTTC